MTTEEIRKELKTIRLYYADKAKMTLPFKSFRTRRRIS